MKSKGLDRAYLADGTAISIPDERYTYAPERDRQRGFTYPALRGYAHVCAVFFHGECVGWAELPQGVKGDM